MRLLCLVVSLFAVAGCAAPVTLDVGYSGSDEGYAAALQAAEVWNQTCGFELVVVHRGEGDVALTEQAGMTDGAMGETTRERPVLGAIGEKRPTSIWFMSGDYALPVLAHEFGHALGLEHADHGIMQPGAEWSQLDPETGRKTLRTGLVAAEDCARVR